MRSITIKREKTFVGSVARIYIYIETENDAEISIQDVPCKQIGFLKNGEEKTFEVEGGKKRIFAIADKASRNFSNDCYLLPEGSDDVVLSGKCKFNLSLGNAFLFKDNNNEETAQRRAQSKKKGTIAIVAALAIGFIIGFSIIKVILNPRVQDKTFTDGGISITLTNEFRALNLEQYNVTYDSKNIAVFALRDPFELAKGLESLTLDEYAELVKTNNNQSDKKIEKSAEGLTYFTYTFENTDTSITYTYYTYLYKAFDAFWIVQFATPESNAAEGFKQINSFARSVSFYPQN